MKNGNAFTQEQTQSAHVDNRIRLREILSILMKYHLAKGITPIKLRCIFEELGPTFVKLGQVLSMREDVLPTEYCQELSKLRTNVQPMAYKEVLSMVKFEYGVNFDEIFQSIDKKPIGSASIAQVHEAQLKDGRAVVIKVQRPHIWETMSRDIALLKKAAQILNIFNSKNNVIDFKMVLNELWTTAQKETDFLIERENAIKYFELNQEVDYVTTPKIFFEYTTSKIMMMEYIEGYKIDDIKHLKEHGYDSKEIASKLAENYIKQVLDDGFFHADPHPGNIIIRDGQIVFIDMGMFGTISRHNQEILKNLVGAIVKKDVMGIKNALLILGVHKKKINHAQLYTDLEELLNQYGEMNLKVFNIGNFIQEMLRIARLHAIQMPSGVTMLGRTVITLEGTLKLLDADMTGIQVMLNYIRKDAKKNLNMMKKTQDLVSTLGHVANKSLSIPINVGDLLNMTVKGQTKINVEITGSEGPLNQIDQMVNKIIACFLAAALLIGSSFIATTQMTPKILGIPALGFLGYIGALILSIHIVWTSYWRKHQQK